MQFWFTLGPKCKRGVWQQHVESEGTTPKLTLWHELSQNLLRIPTNQSSFSPLWEKKNKKHGEKWWIVSSVFSVLLSHRSHFCILPGNILAESKWSKSVSHWCIVSIHWALIAVVVLQPCSSLGLKGGCGTWADPSKIFPHKLLFCHLSFGLASLLANCKAADVLVQSLQVHSYPALGSANQNTLFFCSIKAAAQPTRL